MTTIRRTPIYNLSAVLHETGLSADVLRAWVADGAVIYICGSLNGMAAGVEAAITDILGAAALQDLIEQGRYRRDVY